jgi:hypothetical protein
MAHRITRDDIEDCSLEFLLAKRSALMSELVRTQAAEGHRSTILASYEVVSAEVARKLAECGDERMNDYCFL